MRLGLGVRVSDAWKVEVSETRTCSRCGDCSVKSDVLWGFEACVSADCVSVCDAVKASFVRVEETEDGFECPGCCAKYVVTVEREDCLKGLHRSSCKDAGRCLGHRVVPVQHRAKGFTISRTVTQAPEVLLVSRPLFTLTRDGERVPTRVSRELPPQELMLSEFSPCAPGSDARYAFSGAVCTYTKKSHHLALLRSRENGRYYRYDDARQPTCEEAAGTHVLSDPSVEGEMSLAVFVRDDAGEMPPSDFGVGDVPERPCSVSSDNEIPDVDTLDGAIDVDVGAVVYVGDASSDDVEAVGKDEIALVVKRGRPMKEGGSTKLNSRRSMVERAEVFLQRTGEGRVDQSLSHRRLELQRIASETLASEKDRVAAGGKPNTVPDGTDMPRRKRARGFDAGATKRMLKEGKKRLEKVLRLTAKDLGKNCGSRWRCCLCTTCVSQRAMRRKREMLRRNKARRKREFEVLCALGLPRQLFYCDCRTREEEEGERC